ncbi:MAG: hypothetical protein IJ703_10790 [Eubacterium sp.]|nr:hypothetical protein [Eubacterium sp.]
MSDENKKEKKNGIFSGLFDRITLRVFAIFSGKLKKSLITEQYEKNREAWKKFKPTLEETGGFIEKQSEMKNFAYGTNKGFVGKKLFDGREMNGSDNTCEVIAVYNVTNYLGVSTRGTSIADIPLLIRSFSHKGVAYKGMFGTNPKALKRYLKEKRYTVEDLKGSKINKANCDKLEKKYRAFIFSAFNKGQNPFSMIHTMCITVCDGESGGSDQLDGADETGSKQYQIHNDYEGSKCYNSLYEAVTGYNDGEGHPVYLIAVGR